MLVPLIVLAGDPGSGRLGGEFLAPRERQVAGVARLVEQTGDGVHIDRGEADEGDLVTGHSEDSIPTGP